MDTIEHILFVINKVRPFLINDGGDVEFVSLQDGVVTVRMLGACADCMSINDTLKDGIEALVLDEVPGIVEVRLESTSMYF